MRASDLDACDRWVEFVADRIELGAEFHRAIDRLALMAERRVESETVTLSSDDLDGCLSVSPEDELTFVILVGYILLNGLDGPRVTALRLHEAIKQLERKL